MRKEYNWQCKECGHVFSIVGETHVCLPRSIATDAAIPLPKDAPVEDQYKLWREALDRFPILYDGSDIENLKSKYIIKRKL